MLTLMITFKTWGVLVLVCPAIFYGHCGKWQPHCNGRFCNHCIILADVMPWICGRCYYPFMLLCLRQMESHYGRCYDHCVLRKWQMLLPQVADGIATVRVDFSLIYILRC